jgi:hypothetical protein
LVSTATNAAPTTEASMATFQELAQPRLVIHSWDNFFVAEAGAAAALSGLVFVAVSISLRTILASPHLRARAREALQTFLAVLAIATCGLIPDQSAAALGMEIASFGALKSCPGMDSSFPLSSGRHAPPRPNEVNSMGPHPTRRPASPGLDQFWTPLQLADRDGAAPARPS